MRSAFLAQLSEQDREAFLRQHPPYDCLLCGRHFEYADAEYERVHHVCNPCAESVANHFWHQHSGSWLTWPNQPYVRSGKSKKKIKNNLRWRVYERDGFKCVYCGARKDLTIDHVKAEAEGGETVATNLVTACRPCNSKKHTKSLADFWETRQ